MYFASMSLSTTVSFMHALLSYGWRPVRMVLHVKEWVRAGRRVVGHHHLTPTCRHEQSCYLAHFCPVASSFLQDAVKACL
ncbi:hypothetical protein B0T17DRAFT_353788 [Bombardia bombarda]|uniref:Uncharacterized protein n=1 Tax=Bombardia bombarda TaxID=252184 RepID=A0AA39WI06_9PEZI|nr:hypothetical protein B0T17DRAFT_353788 [Bombardia bombarda]